MPQPQLRRSRSGGRSGPRRPDPQQRSPRRGPSRTQSARVQPAPPWASVGGRNSPPPHNGAARATAPSHSPRQSNQLESRRRRRQQPRSAGRTRNCGFLQQPALSPPPRTPCRLRRQLRCLRVSLLPYALLPLLCFVALFFFVHVSSPPLLVSISKHACEPPNALGGPPLASREHILDHMVVQHLPLGSCSAILHSAPPSLQLPLRRAVFTGTAYKHPQNQ